MKVQALMMPVLLSACLLVSAAVKSQQKISGNGSIKKETRDAKQPFNEISVSGEYKVYISQGGSQSIELEAESNLLPYIETEIHGDDLRIRVKRDHSIRPSREVVIRITVVKLGGIASSGSSHFSSQGTLKGNSLEIAMSGKSVTSLDLQYDKLEVSISGSGKVTLNGQSEKTEIAISGAADIFAADMKSRDVEVAISGSGNAHVQATGKLEVAISGSGNVKYRGSPASVEQAVSGQGRIVKE